MPPLQRHTLSYTSTLDGTGPLLADACFEPDGRTKPVLLVMHGYNGDRTAVSRDLDDLARRGVFALAPDMRGRGGSAGAWDSGGLDVADLVDAVAPAAARFPGELDPANLHVVGYSGGGGNAVAAACRFPDLFRTAVSFFGIPDYAGWYRSRGRPDCNEVMRKVLGAPEEQPARYEARDMIPAAGNAAGTRFHFFWDTEETACPPERVEAWIAARAALPGAGAGGVPAVAHVSRPGDAKRWIHGYRTDHPDLAAADDLFLPDVLASPDRLHSIRLPPRGELAVPGYLITREFSVFLGDGTAGSAHVRYRLDGQRARMEVIDNPRGLSVLVSWPRPASDP